MLFEFYAPSLSLSLSLSFSLSLSVSTSQMSGHLATKGDKCLFSTEESGFEITVNAPA